MAYGVKYRCTHKKEVKGQLTTYVVEILENGYSGGVTNVEGLAEVFSLSYEKISPTEIFQNPIQKGRLEFYLAVGGDTTYNGKAILNEIFEADENQYQMRLKVNGSVYWTGYVLNDLLEYSEGEYVFEGKIVAKDLTRLSGIDHPFLSDRVTIIQTISDILDDLNLGLDIYTYTSWINENTTDSSDFLNQIYNEREGLREFAKTGDEQDTKITDEEALNKLLTNYGLILRQSNNAWRLYQLSALSNPSTVEQFNYNASGSFQSSTSVDLTQDVDKVARYILPSSVNQFNPGVKKVENKFDHRSPVSTIQFPSAFTLDSGNPTEQFSQFFISDGDQTIQVQGSVKAYFSESISTAFAPIDIKIVGTTDYFWDDDNNQWTTGSGTARDVSLTSQGRSTLKGVLHVGRFDIVTDNPPPAADGDLTVTFGRARNGNFATESIFENVQLTIDNSIAKENTKFIQYELTQTADYSVNRELSDTWFGDGPVGYAPSALRFSTSDSDTTGDDWQRRGTTTGYRNLHENLLKEILDVQRSATRNLDGELYGDYDVTNMLSYSGSSLFFLGGNLSGREHRWKGNFLDLNIVTSSNDTFDDILKFTSEGETGTTSDSSTTTTSGGGGLDQETADARYLNENENGADISDPSAFRTNLDVYSTGEVDSLTTGFLATTDVTGSTNQIIVTDNGDGTVTLSTPQDIHTNANVEFNEVTSSRFLFDSGSIVDSIDFHQTTAPAAGLPNALRLYNTSEGGFSTLHYVNSSGVDFEISRDTVHIARNETGATITKGTPVYINGSNGNFPEIAPTNASDSTTLPFFGVVVQDISNSSFGEVLVQGDLKGIDLSAYAQGETLYVDTTAGGLTNVEPSGDNASQIVGTVIKNTVSGILEVERGTLFDYTQPNKNAEFNDIKFNDNLYSGIATPTSLVHIEGSTAGDGGTSSPDPGSGSLVYLKQNTGWSADRPWTLYVEGYTSLGGFRINASDGQRSLYSEVGEIGFGSDANDITFSPTSAGGTRKVKIEGGTGYLGLQTLSPSGALDVSGSTFLRGTVEVNDTLLFNFGGEQTLSTGSNVQFSNVTTDNIQVINVGEFDGNGVEQEVKIGEILGRWGSGKFIVSLAESFGFGDDNRRIEVFWKRSEDTTDITHIEYDGDAKQYPIDLFITDTGVTGSDSYKNFHVYLRSGKTASQPTVYAYIDTPSRTEFIQDVSSPNPTGSYSGSIIYDTVSGSTTHFSAGDLESKGTLTANGTQIFTLGEEQELGTGDNVEFAGGSSGGIFINELSSTEKEIRTPQNFYLDAYSFRFVTTDDDTIKFRIDHDGSARFHKALQLDGDVTFLTQIGSDDYTSGILGAGSLLDNDAPEGSFLEVDNLRVRDSLRTHIFKKDIVRASNGLLYISDASEIADTVTTPATTSTNFVFTVREGVFSSGDTIEYKDADETTGTINSVVASVTDNGTSRTLDGKTVYDYSASLDSGTSVDLRAGDTVVRTSGGNVLIDASTTFSPFIDVLNNGNVKARLGNLDGISDTINGQSVSGYGLYSDNAFLKGGIVATYGAIGGFDISADAISGANFFLSGSATANQQFINANDVFIVRGNGDVTGSSVLFDGGVIGGWTINTSTITGGSVTLNSTGAITIGNTTFGAAGIQLDDTSGGRLYVGDGANQFLQYDGTNLTFSAANTTLDSNGNLTATNANLSGAITASAGTIGGWTISATALSGGNLSLNSSGQIVNSTQINSNNAYQFNNNGSGQVAANNIQWDTSGNVGVTGSITITGGSGISNFTDAGNLATADNLDDVADGSTYARVKSTYLSAGEILLSNVDGNIDDVADGTTYGRVKQTQLSAGDITLVANGTNIRLDASSGILSLNNNTFGSQGIQLDYNSGSPRFYVGDGATSFLQFDGTDLTFDAGNTSLDGSGNLTATNVDLTGTITANDGEIGGWTIGSSSLENIVTGDGIKLEALAEGGRISMFSGSNDVVNMSVGAPLPTLDSSNLSYSSSIGTVNAGTPTQTNSIPTRLEDTTNSTSVTGFSESKSTIFSFDLYGDTNNPSGDPFEWEAHIQASGSDTGGWINVNSFSGDETDIGQTSGTATAFSEALQVVGYTHLRLQLFVTALLDQGQSVDLTAINTDVEQYNPKMTINEDGIFLAVGPSTYLSLASSGAGGGGTVSADVSWGDIGGTLSNQVDLSASLAGKADLSGDTFTGDVYFNGFARQNVGVLWNNQANGSQAFKMEAKGSTVDIMILQSITNPNSSLLDIRAPYVSTMGTDKREATVSLKTTTVDESDDVTVDLYNDQYHGNTEDWAVANGWRVLKAGAGEWSKFMMDFFDSDTDTQEKAIEVFPSTMNNEIVFHKDVHISGSLTVDGTAPGGGGNPLTALNFNTSNGVLTATLDDSSTVTEDLDGRYALTSGDTFTGDITLDDSGVAIFSLKGAGDSFNYVLYRMYGSGSGEYWEQAVSKGTVNEYQFWRKGGGTSNLKVFDVDHSTGLFTHNTDVTFDDIVDFNFNVDFNSTADFLANVYQSNNLGIYQKLSGGTNNRVLHTNTSDQIFLGGIDSSSNVYIRRNGANVIALEGAEVQLDRSLNVVGGNVTIPSAPTNDWGLEVRSTAGNASGFWNSSDNYNMYLRNSGGGIGVLLQSDTASTSYIQSNLALGQTSGTNQLTVNGTSLFKEDVFVDNGTQKILQLLNGTSDYSLIRMIANGTGNNNYFVAYGAGNASHPEFAMKNNQTDGELTFYTNSSKRYTIGNTEVVSTVTHKAPDHVDSSDIRLKSGLKKIDSAVDIANHAKLYSFFKEGLEGRQLGLIAQDMEVAHPDLVGEMNHDTYGKIKTLSGYSLSSIALAGVSELDDRVTKLERENKKLKEELRKLRGE